MEIQIKGIWYNVPDFDAFYNSIEVGDIVTLVLEPENICESEAIAVYFRYKRIGYVKSSELQTVHDILGDRNKVKVAICHKFVDEEDPKLNELEFSLSSPDEAAMMNWKRFKVREFQNLLGDVKISTLVETEVSLELIIDDFIESMDIALKHDIGSAISVAAIEHVIEISDIYIDKSHNSLSAPCTQSMSAICKMLKKMEKKFPDYSRTLHELYIKVKMIDGKFSHEDFIVGIYDRQIEEFIKECSRKNGFFEQYFNTHIRGLGSDERYDCVCLKIKELHRWFEYLPEGLGWFFFNNKAQFCCKLKYAKYGYKNLYTIYTNIALFGFLLDLKQKCPKQEEYRDATMLSQCMVLIQNNHVHYHIQHTDNIDVKGNYYDIHDNKIDN